MNLPTHFISCDWGTTNFRLRVVATDSLSVLAEYATEMGIRGLNEQFLKSKGLDRTSFFGAYLRKQLEDLPAVHRTHPVMICGMASANIGMKELPYGDLPIDAEGRGLLFDDLSPWPGARVRVISGIKNATGMMRGEETQALGLLEAMTGFADGVLLLPGTHSKHLTYEAGQFTDFTSYMTGELFEVISRNSILSQSVSRGEWNARTGDSFKQGVNDGAKDGFPHHLFSIRASQLLRQTDTTDNFYQLSGLLIGDELAHLPQDGAQKIYLAGSGPLLRLYTYALEVLGYGERLTVFDDKLLSEAMLTGQRLLLMRETSNL